MNVDLRVTIEIDNMASKLTAGGMKTREDRNTYD